MNQEKNNEMITTTEDILKEDHWVKKNTWNKQNFWGYTHEKHIEIIMTYENTLFTSLNQGEKKGRENIETIITNENTWKQSWPVIIHSETL